MTQLELRAIVPLVEMVPPVNPLPAVIAVTVPDPGAREEMRSWLPDGMIEIFEPATRLVQIRTFPVEADRAMPGPAEREETPLPPPPPPTISTWPV
jgi:hypothetical protein